MLKGSFVKKGFVSTEMVNSIILQQEKRNDEQLLLSVTTLTLRSSIINTKRDNLVEFDKRAEKLIFIKNSI